jgi:hypothetical protein
LRMLRCCVLVEARHVESRIVEKNAENLHFILTLMTAPSQGLGTPAGVSCPLQGLGTPLRG